MKTIAFRLAILVACVWMFFAGSSFAQTGSQTTPFDPEKHKILSTDRPDGRYTSTRGLVQHMIRSQHPLLAFDPAFSRDEFLDWQTKVRNKLQDLMRFPDIPPQPQPRLLSRAKRNGYTLEKWEHYPQPGSVVPFLVLVPDGVSASDSAPAVLCLPGTSRSKESLAGEKELFPVFARPTFDEINRMALLYAQKGIVAVAVDNPGYAETSDLEQYSGQDVIDVATFEQYLLNMNWHYMGLATFQSHQLLKWMRTSGYINPEKIAVSGHSLGAWMAAYLAVLNPDICAVVLNQGIYNWREAAKVRTKPNERGQRPPAFGLFYVVPGMYGWFDNPDIVASLAPRPVLFAEGLPEKNLELYQKAYGIMDATDNMTVSQFPKYRAPETRYDGYLPEGLTTDEFWKLNNNDPPDHYFKADVAVPWLENRLKP